jgi:hypothetical protein
VKLCALLVLLYAPDANAVHGENLRHTAPFSPQ